MSPSQRQRIENKRRQAKRQQTIIWSIVSVVILGAVAFVVFQSPGEDDHTHAVSFPEEGVGNIRHSLRGFDAGRFLRNKLTRISQSDA